MINQNLCSLERWILETFVELLICKRTYVRTHTYKIYVRNILLRFHIEM